MEKIITPETLENIPVGTPKVTISRRGIHFNQAAKLTLNLQSDDKFVLVEKYGSLFYKEAQNGNGFTVGINLRSKSARAGSHKLFTYLKLEKSTTYLLKNFKDGMRELKKL